LVFLADRLELFGVPCGSGWSVLLAIAIVCLGMLGGLIWFVVSLLLRRRFQFGLKSLLLFTALVAILCSWCAARMRQARRQKEAVLAIEDAGGHVLYDHEFRFDDGSVPQLPHPPGWPPPPCLLDLHFQHDVAYLTFSRATDAELIHLESLTSLDSLDLQHTDVTDVGLVHVKGLRSLRKLWLDDTQVTDAGLLNLKELSRLQCLDLSGTQVTDAGLVNLKELPRLQWLNLSRTQVTDAGLVHLKTLTNLKELLLYETHVSDHGVDKLRLALPNCRISHEYDLNVPELLPPHI